MNNVGSPSETVVPVFEKVQIAAPAGVTLMQPHANYRICNSDFSTKRFLDILLSLFSNERYFSACLSRYRPATELVSRSNLFAARSYGAPLKSNSLTAYPRPRFMSSLLLKKSGSAANPIGQPMDAAR